MFIKFSVCRCLKIEEILFLWFLNNNKMKPIVSIIMGSTSDMPVMRKAAEFLDKMEIPFEINALSTQNTSVSRKFCNQCTC